MNDRLLVEAVATLGAWQPPDVRQAGLRDAYLAHLAAEPDGLWKQGPPQHLTASCFVLDPAARRVLLVLHRKGGFWVQPGGHLEPGDDGLLAAALREAAEETGLGARDLAAVVPHPVDLDRHTLPSTFGRCTEHLDVGFAATADPATAVAVSAESTDLGWFDVDALPAGAVADLAVRLPRAVASVRSGAGVR